MNSGIWCRRALLMVVVVIMVTTACLRISNDEGKVRDDLPLDSLHDGDLVFRQGMGPESQAVLRLDSAGGQYSHVGIVINDNGKWKVVHAVPGESEKGIDRVKIEPIDTFFLSTRAEHGAIMRLKGCDITTAQKAARNAAKYVGIPFDYNYNWGDTTRLYCTQLIVVAYSSAGVNLLSDVPRLANRNSQNIIVFPGDIAINDSMRVIFKF
ncbi:MAG: hypothetical protein IK100_11415 [Muribaculaceae bacterium]|nr:hypothetical protein [Muribaculaceae bacterium]